MALAKRTSERLSAYNVERARAAAKHARRLDRDFTHALTVHWSDTDGADTAQMKQGRLLTCARRWLERRNEPLVCLWSVEANKHGEGEHSHILLNLPTRRRNLVRDFSAMLPAWTNTELLDKKTAHWANGKPSKGTVACGGYAYMPYSPIWVLQRRYDDSDKLLNYFVLKASQPHNHCTVIGKRIGCSNNLGPAAIKRWSVCSQARWQ